MATNSITIAQTEAYWNLLRNASNEVKLRLIEKLTRSLLTTSQKEHHPTKDEDAFYELAGAWKGNMTTDEIIEVIADKRSSDNSILLDQ
ncbi:MAG: hypothetical protein K2K58_06805 [Muribaculaceae bacterium]|nr:hypothetical protein [Muribaculaceae bacterium]